MFTHVMPLPKCFGEWITIGINEFSIAVDEEGLMGSFWTALFYGLDQI